MDTALDMDGSDKTILERLNQEYVNAFLNADVEWYRKPWRTIL